MPPLSTVHLWIVPSPRVISTVASPGSGSPRTAMLEVMLASAAMLISVSWYDGLQIESRLASCLLNFTAISRCR